MKNKMKEWRRKAKTINAQYGSKHNGRKLKMSIIEDKPATYPLLAQLMQHAGISRKENNEESSDV